MPSQTGLPEEVVQFSTPSKAGQKADLISCTDVFENFTFSIFRTEQTFLNSLGEYSSSSRYG